MSFQLIRDACDNPAPQPALPAEQILLPVDGVGYSGVSHPPLKYLALITLKHFHNMQEVAQQKQL